ncbi:MAG: phenylacetate--CoA ligase family protein [Candidatus Cloacimonetes bacterium]|nr:phenylacetate--CoA ligase family protein [Candidatus Cloacimonadota bacterium]
MFRRKIVYPIVFKLKNQPVFSILEELENTQWYSREELKKYQWKKFKQILNHSYNHSKYYNNLFKKNKLNPDDIKTLQDISRIPILTKSDFVKNSSDIQIAQKNVSVWRTSGISGSQIMCYKNSIDRAYWYAFKYRYFRWFDINMDDQLLLLWRRVNEASKGHISRVKEIFIDYLLNIKRISPVNIHPEELDRVLSLLCNNSPTFLRGYASAIYSLAKYALQKNKLIYPNPIKVIISTGEMLFHNQRKIINKVFNTPISNEYGANECGLIATECKEGQMHIQDENVLVEIVNEDGFHTVKTGRIILTALNSFATPFIRYEIGDTGSVENIKCECGRCLSVLKSIEGRVFDFIVLPDGRRLSIVGIFVFEILTKLPRELQKIDNFQIIQNSDDELLFKLLSQSKKFSIIKKFIKKEIKRYIGDSVKIEIQQVSKIQPDKNGKQKLLISNINKTNL